MQIIRLERVRSRPPRVRIHVEDGPPLVVSDEVIARFAVGVGDELGTARWEEIRRAQESGEARRIAINYLSYRPRSEREVVRHLVGKKIAEEVAEQTAARLRSLQMIDDDAFARMFVRDRLRRGGHGPGLLRQLLIQKGVARAIVDHVVPELASEENQRTAAVALARGRLRRSSGRKEDALRRRKRLYDLLLRRGFSNDIARAALQLLKV
ncbi:MAG: RecX family transcriptional regulator [Bacteroidota bacterium]